VHRNILRTIMEILQKGVSKMPQFQFETQAGTSPGEIEQIEQPKSGQEDGAARRGRSRKSGSDG
jgi:hypothetical protein